MRLAIWNSAVGLLLITGMLLGLSLPFGKLSGAAGVEPVIWALVISFGAGSVLLAALLARGKARWPNGGRLRYFAITAAISYAFPNLLIMSAIPHLGAGFTGIMFTLSPVITLTLSVLLGMRRPGALGVPSGSGLRESISATAWSWDSTAGSNRCAFGVASFSPGSGDSQPCAVQYAVKTRADAARRASVVRAFPIVADIASQLRRMPMSSCDTSVRCSFAACSSSPRTSAS